MKEQVEVSLKLKHEVIIEPELTAGDVLWNLIKARQEELVTRTMGRSTAWDLGCGVPRELSRASQHEVAEKGQEPVYPADGTWGRDSNPASVTY